MAKYNVDVLVAAELKFTIRAANAAKAIEKAQFALRTVGGIASVPALSRERVLSTDDGPTSPDAPEWTWEQATFDAHLATS